MQTETSAMNHEPLVSTVRCLICGCWHRAYYDHTSPGGVELFAITCGEDYGVDFYTQDSIEMV